MRDFIEDFDQVAVKLRCVTALCGTPGFVKYHLIIASSDSIFVASVSKDFHYNFIYELNYLTLIGNLNHSKQFHWGHIWSKFVVITLQ